MKVIAFYEDHWMAPGTDFAQWDHLVRAFGGELQMIRDWTEAVIPNGATIVIADEFGVDELATFEHPESAVYVFGRSAQDLAHMVPYDVSVRIDTPETVSLFGVCAAAIILRSRG